MMSFIGDESEAAPGLAQARLSRTELEEAWRQLTSSLIALTMAGLVHADLSAYNLLWWEGRLWSSTCRRRSSSRRTPMSLLTFSTATSGTSATGSGRRSRGRQPRRSTASSWQWPGWGEVRARRLGATLEVHARALSVNGARGAASGIAREARPAWPHPTARRSAPAGPTPSVYGSHQSSKSGCSRLTVRTVVAMLPSPAASNSSAR